MQKKIVFFVLIILIAGCNKNKNENSDYSYIDTRMKDFFFKPGTYWIFKNHSLNIRDSKYIINALHEYSVFSNGRQIENTEYWLEDVHKERRWLKR